MDDLGEAGGIQACSAYQCSIDVFKAAEARGVVGLDGASVEDASGGGECGSERLCDLGADDLVGVFGGLGGGGVAGADGPDGLVGEDEIGGGVRVDAFEGDRDLKFEDLGGEVGFALDELLADADDGGEAVGEGGLELEVDGGVGLVEVLAAFAVADQDVGDADGTEHEGRRLTGVGTFFVPVHVLRADVNGCAACSICDRGKAGHGREEDDLGPCGPGKERKEGVKEAG